MSVYYPEKQGLYDPANERDSCGVGFVAHVKGEVSNTIIRRGLEVLVNMSHRGAAGADQKTGDGAGILIQVPHDFFASLYPHLPKKGDYGVGLVFLPQDDASARFCEQAFEKIVKAEGQELLLWRDVPVDSSMLGKQARASEPRIKQVFIGKGKKTGKEAFERKLYLIRKVAETTIRDAKIRETAYFYIPSLSSQTLIYKGMFLPEQLEPFFLDLQSPKLASALALVHSRFSTNTFPTWDLAQPFRMLAHNGEINTIKGNILKMHARESTLASDLFGAGIKKLFPIIRPGGSDSASLDNALEMLVECGRSLPHAMMMLIPEAWNEKNPIPDHRRAFYEYYSTLMEPWDGPATIAFTDGKVIGATLDRNGLRPARYIVTEDDLVVFASEMGVQTFPAERIEYKGRLYPGKMLLVDLEEKRIISDDEIKDSIANRRPYRDWVENNRISLADLACGAPGSAALSEDDLHRYQLLFGYTLEDLNAILVPMVVQAEEPVGSMGTDTPLAILSDRPQRLFNYFKQLFAQVTNPPIDPIREEMVMSLTSYMGPQKNLLEETPEHCRMMKYRQPIFTPSEIQTLIHGNHGFKSTTLPILFKKTDGAEGLETALSALAKQASEAIRKGCHYLILSDRDASEELVPIPSLLASAALHHHLIREQTRTQVALILVTGEPREVMHMALLVGYGADAIHPYLAFATITDLVAKKMIPLDDKSAEKNYVKALGKGLLKVLSKMGISTLRSYRGAQLFEALGLSQACIDKYFTGTTSRIGGLDLGDIGREALIAHDVAYARFSKGGPFLLPSEGVYHYRTEGERHAWNPETISFLQRATRDNDPALYRQFSKIVNDYNREHGVLRGFFDLKKMPDIPLAEVEPVEAIVKRFVTGAMSYGSISKETHESLAIAMNTLGGKSNTGEGGEDSARFKRRPDGTSTRSAVKQIASARFGVTNHYLRNADEIQIKIAQGAKPGEGGQLPGHKVDEVIAKLRHSTPGVSLISPPPHHDIYSIEDLKQLIFDLKHVNPKAAVSVKLVAEIGVGTVAAGVAKANADTVNISGYDGGTGASPISSIKHAGVPWELGVAETQQTLVLNDLRGRIRLHTDGQMKTGRDVVIAALLGAEEFAFSTAPLITLGCIMMRKCHLNTCPVGVATQDPELRKRFIGDPTYVIRYFTFLAEEIREIMASLGIRKFEDLVGRSDLMRVREAEYTGSTWKQRGLDLSALLYKPERAGDVPIRYVATGVHPSPGGLDAELLAKVKPFLQAALKSNEVLAQGISLTLPIRNIERAVGAMLSGEISDLFGEAGLPDNTIRCMFKGTAGQSFGAFLARGLTFVLEGDANDYLGKGLSGGRIAIVPPQGSKFVPEKNIIVGNTVLYGAIAGEVFVRGIAGERFCVRNSGVIAVVEGVGDHGCEYMTGGTVAVLGKTGRNFAAGMSGGLAFVLDRDGGFSYFCNPDMVELSGIDDPEDEESLRLLIEQHTSYTHSRFARDILDDWASLVSKFVKLTPIEYRKALAKQGLKPVFRYPSVAAELLREVAIG